LDFKNPETILVLQIGKIGDMILTTPLFSELKRLYPGSLLTVLASETNKDIPKNHHSVNKVIVFQKNIFKNFSIIKSVFGKFDIWIDTKDNFSNTGKLLLKLFNPHFSLGFSFPEAKISFNSFLNDYVTGEHAVDLNLSPVNYFENDKTKLNILPSFNIPAEISNKFKEFFNIDYKIKTLINVSAGNKNRYIAKEKWVDLINKFNENSTLRFYITGIEADSDMINFIMRSSLNKNLEYIPTKNILETAEIVKRSDLVITPDTSVVHICSAFNKPIVAVYPNVKWNYEKFRPLSIFNEVVFSKTENSIVDVTSDSIFEAVEKILIKISSGNAESRTRVRKEDH
jgi:ADP-heptose:LPS heptosyltransferase